MVRGDLEGASVEHDLDKRILVGVLVTLDYDTGASRQSTHDDVPHPQALDGHVAMGRRYQRAGREAVRMRRRRHARLDEVLPRQRARVGALRVSHAHAALVDTSDLDALAPALEVEVLPVLVSADVGEGLDLAHVLRVLGGCHALETAQERTDRDDLAVHEAAHV